MRRLAKLLAVLALLGAAALCVGGLAVGVVLTKPSRPTIGPPPDDLGAEPVAFASTSGATIRGWFVNGRPRVGAVVLLHGVGGNRIPMLQRARMLREAGYSVLLFDFQAHGESTGSWITLGRREGLDAAAAVAFMRQRLPAEKVAAIGVSLGGAAALLAPAPLAVDALVLEGAFPDIDTAIANRIQLALGPWLGPLMRRPLAEVLVTMTSPIIGVSRAELRPIDHIAAVDAPLLMLVGDGDKHTTVAETQAMFERAREPKSMWVVPGAGHVDLRDHAPEAYRARILQFLAERLRP